MIINSFRKEELESVGELSEVRSQIVLKWLYLGQIGSPDILWSVKNLFDPSQKWTQACDNWLARLTSYIHHRRDNRQHCHVENAAPHC